MERRRPSRGNSWQDGENLSATSSVRRKFQIDCADKSALIGWCVFRVPLSFARLNLEVLSGQKTIQDHTGQHERWRPDQTAIEKAQLRLWCCRRRDFCCNRFNSEHFILYATYTHVLTCKRQIIHSGCFHTCYACLRHLMITSPPRTDGVPKFCSVQAASAPTPSTPFTPSSNPPTTSMS